MMSVTITHGSRDDRQSEIWRAGHLVVCTVGATLLCFVTVIGISLPLFWQAVLFGLTVSVIGIPHGGLDHKYGRAVCRPWAGRWWSGVFLGAYLGMGLVVLAGWIVAPLLTVVVFFVASAVHFGERGLSLAAVAEGGMVIYLPFLARPEEACRLLSWVIPVEIQQPVNVYMRSVSPIFWVLAAVLVITISRFAWTGVRHANLGRLATAIRLISFSAAFTILPVLVSFMAFFCGWHSLRELGYLAREANGLRPVSGLWTVLREAAPLAVITVIGIAVAAIWGMGAGGIPEPVVVRSVFLALSIVAIPHIVLHAVADRMGAHAFASGVDQ